MKRYQGVCILMAGCLMACQPEQASQTNQHDTKTTEMATSQAVNTKTQPEPVMRPNVSQQFVGISPVEIRLAYALPEIPYQTEALSDFAKKVNQAQWQADVNTSHADTSQQAALANTADAKAQTQEVSEEQAAIAIRIQALLNYHHHKVGAVTGEINQNTIKAMQVFQQKHNLETTEAMNEATWQALTADETLMAQPVLVKYTLTQEDVDIPYHPKGQQYRSVKEAVAEKFQMSQALLSKLNPESKLKVGDTITVYNPYQPNTQEVHKVVADKGKNILFAYNQAGELVASYPTTVGSSYKPSPSGAHKVVNRVLNPYYNKDFSNKNSVLPPGPNNPVGRVWIGISRPSYGIHGSPDPEKISQQHSSGCVRLTNWDALALFGTIQDGAEVEFL